MALFNSAMFGGGMGLLPQFFPEQMLRDIRPRADTPLFDVTIGGGNINFGRPGSLTGDTFADRFGAMQPPAQQPQANAPQMQAPAQAAAGFAAPDSSYAMGGGNQPVQNVPVFGQPESAAIPPNAMPTAGRAPMPQGPINPQAAAPAMQSQLLAPAPQSASDKWNDFLGRLNPEIGARNDAKKAQAETARGMYEVFIGQGFEPKVAAAKAVIAARNPKVLEEVMKPYANYEQRLANQPNGTPQQFFDFLGGKKGAEVAAEKKAGTQAEAQINLPGTMADVQQTMQTIQELRNHKGRNSLGWHGPTANIPDDMLKGSEAFGAIKLQDRLLARTFTDQVKTMVGMGALSNAEGAKITDAVASLSRGLKKAEYDKALDFTETALKNGIDKMSVKAGNNAPFGFKGNDGWQSVSPDVRIRERR